MSLAFGNVTVGQTPTLNLQLTNQGTTNLVIDATTITGTDAAQFSDNFNDAGNITLAAGASTTVIVTFAPTSAGSKTATLAITHSGTNTPLQVPLSGTGTTPSRHAGRRHPRPSHLATSRWVRRRRCNLASDESGHHQSGD